MTPRRLPVRLAVRKGPPLPGEPLPTARPATVASTARPTAVASSAPQAITAPTATTAPSEPTRAPRPTVRAPLAETSVETDRQTLEALFSATNGEDWDKSGTWLSFTPLEQWQGVTVDREGRVVALRLERLSGQIPRELDSLTKLTSLSLGGTLGEIPPELSNLVNLQVLSLGGVSGEIPPELSQLVGLESLGLSGQELRGGIPPELGQLVNLTSLGLGYTQLGGEIPAWLGNLVNLTSLSLRGSQLSGEIPPELGQLANLERLNLSRNQLSGQIPAELGNLEVLGELELNHNQLSGEIPLELDSLDLLEDLTLQKNELTGCISDFLEQKHKNTNDPLELPKCTASDRGDAEALVALLTPASGSPWPYSNWLSREPIGEWSGVSTDRNGNVVGLGLSGSRFWNDNLRALSSLSHLRTLVLGLDHYDDDDRLMEIPPSVGSITSLRRLEFAVGDLAGSIPPEMGRLTNLRELDLGMDSIKRGDTSRVGQHDQPEKP